VYVVSVSLKSPSLQITLQKRGMMNIGIRPTVNGKSRVIEVHIFDFDETIYQQTIQVKLLHFLRDEVKFNTLEELKNQLSADRQQAINWLQQQPTL
jgi:riboflavin kinase/FMN adenylyltransferase